MIFNLLNHKEYFLDFLIKELRQLKMCLFVLLYIILYELIKGS
jgi:hypothetical protein